MSYEKNTPELWDDFWGEEITQEEDFFAIAKEEKSIRWQRIEQLTKLKFGSFQSLDIIELGAGAGTNAALMAKRGANVTILDYSERALNRSQEFFRRNGLEAEFVYENALSLPESFGERYDVSMSFGLTEHFKGAERVKINKVHFDVLKAGGITFISVPNRYNFPYRINKSLGDLLGISRVGEEYPYSRKELKQLCQELGISTYSFFGDSLFWSFTLINPLRVLKKILGVKPCLDVDKIKEEKGSFLDEYLSYALVLYAEKV
jgi:2-polyprenyl-3-methyl-5-hydroxy-6-metoxy-1,4-benzoquinol methylase